MLTADPNLRHFGVKRPIDDKNVGPAMPQAELRLGSQRWARMNPASWAASSLLNQTSAMVRP